MAVKQNAEKIFAFPVDNFATVLREAGRWLHSLKNFAYAHQAIGLLSTRQRCTRRYFESEKYPEEWFVEVFDNFGRFERIEFYRGGNLKRCFFIPTPGEKFVPIGLLFD